MVALALFPVPVILIALREESILFVAAILFSVAASHFCC